MEIKLSEEEKVMLRNLDKDFEFLEKEIERAKSVGLDTSEIEEQLNFLKSLRDKLLETYG